MAWCLCLPGQYAQLYVCVWFLALSGCVSLLESEAFRLLFSLPGISFPTSPFGSPFFTFFSVRKYNTHSFYGPSAVCEFPAVAVPDYHRQVVLKQQICTLENPGGRKSGIKALPELAFSTDRPGGEDSLMSLPVSGWLRLTLCT